MTQNNSIKPQEVLQEAPGRPRRPQEAPGAPNRPQEAPRAPPGAPKWPQQVPLATPCGPSGPHKPQRAHPDDSGINLDHYLRPFPDPQKSVPRGSYLAKSELKLITLFQTKIGTATKPKRGSRLI